MKKILAMMMVMLIAATAVFAEITTPAATTVQLQYIITDVSNLAYSIKYGNEEKANNAVVSIGSSNAQGVGIVAGTSGSKFTILDKSLVNGVHAMNFVLSFADAKWLRSDNTPTNSTLSFNDDYKLLNTAAANASVTATDSTTNTEFVKHFTVSYSGSGVDRTAVENATGVAEFSVDWTGDSNQAADTFHANLSIAVTAV